MSINRTRSWIPVFSNTWLQPSKLMFPIFLPPLMWNHWNKDCPWASLEGTMPGSLHYPEAAKLQRREPWAHILQLKRAPPHSWKCTPNGDLKLNWPKRFLPRSYGILRWTTLPRSQMRIFTSNIKTLLLLPFTTWFIFLLMRGNTKSLDFLTKVVLNNRIALSYLLTEQGGVCVVAGISCSA